MGLSRRFAPSRWCLTAILTLAFVGAGLGARAERRQTPSLQQILRLAGEYVERFDNVFANVVSEERYEQATGRTRGLLTRHRDLVSDFLMVKLPNTDGWLPFRDVLSVDGEPVRDPDGRLVRLLSAPDPLSLLQAQAILAQSASYNIGVPRTMNLPVLGLQVLRPANAGRFEFSNLQQQDLDGLLTYRVDYEEHDHPTIITGPNGRDMPMMGRVWIEPDGTIAKTELRVNQVASIRVEVTTRYRADPDFGVSIPIEMREEYTERNGRRTSGIATYGRFRRFVVETSSAMDSVRPE